VREKPEVFEEATEAVLDQREAEMLDAIASQALDARLEAEEGHRAHTVLLGEGRVARTKRKPPAKDLRALDTRRKVRRVIPPDGPDRIEARLPGAHVAFGRVHRAPNSCPTIDQPSHADLRRGAASEEGR